MANNLPTIEEISCEDLKGMKQKVDFSFLGLDVKKSYSTSIHHWLSETLFEKVLSYYLQKAEYKKPYLPQHYLDFITKNPENMVARKCYYLILVAEATRFTAQQVTGQDIQQKQGQLVAEECNKMIQWGVVQAIDNLRTYVKGQNYFFDDRIKDYTKLGFNVNRASVFRDTVVPKIKQQILWIIKCMQYRHIKEPKYWIEAK